MEQYPPSYEMATARDVWVIVAPYIPSADLCAASLVSTKWHQMFVPFLWGAPASHFGVDNDAMYGGCAIDTLEFDSDGLHYRDHICPRR